MRKNNNHLSAPQSRSQQAKEVVQSKHVDLYKQTTSDTISGGKTGYMISEHIATVCNGRAWRDLTDVKTGDSGYLGDRVGICRNIFSRPLTLMWIITLKDLVLRSYWVRVGLPGDYVYVCFTGVATWKGRAGFSWKHITPVCVTVAWAERAVCLITLFNVHLKQYLHMSVQFNIWVTPSTWLWNVAMWPNRRMQHMIKRRTVKISKWTKVPSETFFYSLTKPKKIKT